MYLTINDFTQGIGIVIFEEDACKLLLYLHLKKCPKRIISVNSSWFPSFDRTEVTEQIEWMNPARMLPRKCEALPGNDSDNTAAII